MKKTIHLLIILIAAVSLTLAGCGGSGSSGTTSTPALDAGGSGLALEPTDDGDPTTEAATFANALAINDSNQVVGASESAAGASLSPVMWEVDLDGNTVGAATPLAALVPNGFAAALGINADGVIVGVAANQSNGTRAVVWTDAAAAPAALQLLTPGGASSAYAINDSGRIIGEAENAAGLFVPVRWERAADGTISGPFVLPGVPAGWEGGAYAINNGNQIAGELIDPEGTSTATLWQLAGDAYVRLDLTTPAGFSHSVALGINDPAPDEPLLIAGEVSDDGIDSEFHAMKWSVTGTTVTETDLGIASSASAVNTSGRVAGFESTGTGTSLATVWDSANVSSALFTTDSQAFDINANNLVVGRSGSQGFVKRVN